MIKRFFAMLLSVTLAAAFCLVGCSSDTASSENAASMQSSLLDTYSDNNSSSETSSTLQPDRAPSTPASVTEDGDYEVDYDNPNEGKFDLKFTFDFMTAEDDALLEANPDRGFRTEMVLYIAEEKREGDDPRTAYITDSKAAIRDKLNFVFDVYFKKGVNPNDKLFLAYIYITDFRDDHISKAAPVLTEFFEMCRERRVKSMLRFCYNNNYAINFTLSQENRDKLASQCADEQTILRHIDELAPYIKEYSDTIHTISCGFVGFVGEWAYHYQYPVVNYETVMKAIVEKLCVPNGLYFSIRLPEYKARLGKDYKYNDYIGYNNDAMYGEQTNYNWNSAGYQIGTDGWWETVTRVAAYTPQDGEMYTNDVLFNYNMLPRGWDIIKECAHHRHTSMSNWHGYFEALSRDNIIDRWIENEIVTPSVLHHEKILHDPNWFLDSKGKSVKRNPYEFLRDHLGYRLQLYSGSAKGNALPNDSINTEIVLRNYGFAAPFMLESGFAVLDKNYNVVSETKAGNPEKWYSHAPDNSDPTAVLYHTVSAKVKMPDKKGKYFVAFYLRNKMGDSARLANKMSFKNGYNLLYAVVIR